MRLLPRILLSFYVALVPLAYATAEEAEPREPSRQVLETMRQHVASLKAVSTTSDGKELPLKLIANPVLRYSDPGGITTDGAIWLWGEPGRPAAAAGVFFLTQEGKEPKWSCELLSLADGPATVQSQAGWKWSPDSGGLHWIALKDTPGENARERLRQMKQIAERYDVASYEGTLRSQQRLMVQPLHRYYDEPRDLLDGAIFAFASGTNPEALLLVECRKEGGAPAWHVAFTRMGANALQARQGETVVWECPAIQRWDVKEPYFSKFGPVEEVFAPK